MTSDTQRLQSLHGHVNQQGRRSSSSRLLHDCSSWPVIPWRQLVHPDSKSIGTHHYCYADCQNRTLDTKRNPGLYLPDPRGGRMLSKDVRSNETDENHAWGISGMITGCAACELAHQEWYRTSSLVHVKMQSRGGSVANTAF